jgi:FKBP-type peptidyl-prolyl cis-trans isomerase SlpA
MFPGISGGVDRDMVEEGKMVSDGKMIKVHYTLTVEGTVVDSSEGKDPLEFQMGNRQVIQGFEKGLMGMKVGEKKSFQVVPKEGYGDENPEAIHELSIDKLPPGVKPEKGMTLYAKGQDGQPMPVRITDIKDDVVVVNFNHPIAGKTLAFEVEIIDVN